MAWNRQESRVLTVLTARESGKARERGPGSAQSACGNVAHTKSAGGCKGAKVLESDWKLRKLPFQGSGREQAYQWVEHLSKPNLILFLRAVSSNMTCCSSGKRNTASSILAPEHF